MPDFTSSYVPPGVYIEEQLTTTVPVVGTGPSVLAIVGPALGYRANTESMSFNEGSDSRDLDRGGVNLSSVRVENAGGTVFTVETDYTLSQDADVTTIDWVDNGGISPNELVYVSYQYTDDSYHAVQRFSDLDSVQDFYGQALDVETGDILSPLSFAARFAFANGARQLALVATTDTIPELTSGHFDTALGKLTVAQDIAYVVPLPVGFGDGNVSDVINSLSNHLDASESDGHFRIGVFGADHEVSTDPSSLADGASSRRLVLVHPNRMNYYHGYANQTFEVDGFYLAAAVAGRLVSLAPQVPLTRKRIYGFSGIPSAVLQSMTSGTKNQWSQDGVAVVEPNRQNQLVIRHGVTTAVGNIHSREISLVQTRDALVNMLQETFDSTGLVGSYITGQTINRVKTIATGVLERALSSELIVGYQGLKARQLNVDPSVIEVKFEYQPAYPLNYVVISFSVNTTTGAVNLGGN